MVTKSWMKGYLMTALVPGPPWLWSNPAPPWALVPWLPPVSGWNATIPVCLGVACGRFPAAAELRSCVRDCVAFKAQNVSCLQKKGAIPQVGSLEGRGDILESEPE